MIPKLESLESRDLLAVSAVFDARTLVVRGDSRPNAIVVYADPTGAVRVSADGANIPIRVTPRTAPPTLESVRLVWVEGGAGNDIIRLDASLGVVDALIRGGAGHDTIQADHAGFTFADGGAGNDLLIGGPGKNNFVGGSGNDRYLCQPGKTSDYFDGGTGVDTVEIAGEVGDVFTRSTLYDFLFVKRERAGVTETVILQRTETILTGR